MVRLPPSRKIATVVFLHFNRPRLTSVVMCVCVCVMDVEISTDWTQLCDGLAILQAFSEIDSTAARDEPEPEPEVAPLQTTHSTRSLQQFLAKVDRFIVTQLQGTVNLSHIDIDSIAHRAVSAETSLIVRPAVLLLGDHSVAAF